MNTIKWTEETIAEEALKYVTKNDFKRNAAGAVHAANRLGIYNEVCSHMQKFTRVWTFEKVQEEALKYTSKADFRNNCPAAYTRAHRDNIVDKVCKHMEPKVTFFTKEELIKIASNYTDIGTFKREQPKAYHAIYRKNIKEELTSHMKGSPIKWTIEKIMEESLKYTSKTEFRNNNTSAYNAAKRLGIWETLYGPFRKNLVKHRYNIPTNTKGIYLLYNDEDIVYIGKSINCIGSRIVSHIKDKSFNEVHVYSLQSLADIDILENYLINKHKPKYNSTQNSGDVSVNISNLNEILTLSKIYKE